MMFQFWLMLLVGGSQSHRCAEDDLCQLNHLRDCCYFARQVVDSEDYLFGVSLYRKCCKSPCQSSDNTESNRK